METLQGRGQLRLIVQPVMGIILGIRFGILDAKQHEDPFLLRLLLTGENRRQLAKQALRAVLIPFSIAIVLDGILQYLALGYVRPLAAVVVGAILIWLPFSVSRSLTNRAYRRRHPAPTG